jgi:predicted ribosome quality control (RQC) complex YloA/Tae2 family protein
MKMSNAKVLTNVYTTITEPQMQQDYTDSQVQAMNDGMDHLEEAEHAYALAKENKEKADKIMTSLKGIDKSTKEAQDLVNEAAHRFHQAALLFDKSAKLYEEAVKHSKP